MADYLGDYAEDATVIVPWNTNNGDGAAITRATDGNIRIYKNALTTEKATANGITDNEDFDSVTGVHLVVIDTSNDTGDSGFWDTGNDYWVVLQGAIIDGQTVNHVLAHFSIENRGFWSYSGRTLTQSAATIVSAVSGAELTGYTDIDWSFAITGLGDISDYSKIWFTVKEKLTDVDNQALVQIDTTTGLVVLNKLTTGITAGDGVITIDDSAAGDITITLDADATAVLKKYDKAHYDIKILRTGGGTNLLADGTRKFNIARAVTETLS